MCGRYALSGTPDEIGTAFGLTVRENFPPRYNIAPTQGIAVIHRGEGADPERARRFTLMRWGFIPSWAAKAKNATFQSKPLINARSETVGEKPTFRNAFRRRRCLVPATGFYEWKSEKDGKQPYFIQPSEPANAGGVFGFAAIWETAVDVDGGEMDTVAILTSAAGEDMAELHGREPVVIAPDDYGRWLMNDETDKDAVADLLAAAPGGFWRAHAVDKAVGNVRNEGARLAEPLPETGALF